MSRSRPPAIESEVIVQSILKYREKIILKDEENCIVKEKDSIWHTISNDLKYKVQPTTLYSYAVNNRFSIKNLLLGKSSESFENLNASNCNIIESSSDYESDFNYKNNIIFTLTFGKSEFEKMIIQSARSYKDKKGIPRVRIINVLKPEKWTEIISKRIYNDFNLSHGYHFKYNYINSDKESGGFKGKFLLL